MCRVPPHHHHRGIARLTAPLFVGQGLWALPALPCQPGPAPVRPPCLSPPPARGASPFQGPQSPSRPQWERPNRTRPPAPLFTQQGLPKPASGHGRLGRRTGSSWPSAAAAAAGTTRTAVRRSCQAAWPAPSSSPIPAGRRGRRQARREGLRSRAAHRERGREGGQLRPGLASAVAAEAAAPTLVSPAAGRTKGQTDGLGHGRQAFLRGLRGTLAGCPRPALQAAPPSSAAPPATIST